MTNTGNYVEWVWGIEGENSVYVSRSDGKKCIYVGESEEQKHNDNARVVSTKLDDDNSKLKTSEYNNNSGNSGSHPNEHKIAESSENILTEQHEAYTSNNDAVKGLRELPTTHEIHVDWRRLLGGMLIREVGGIDATQKRNYVLVQFPEHYALYQEYSQTSEDTRLPGSVYLYGHPKGKSGRFDSAADFFPHLLWLATDSTGNEENCPCRLCCPDELLAKSSVAASNSVRRKYVKKLNPSSVSSVKSSSLTNAVPDRNKSVNGGYGSGKVKPKTSTNSSSITGRFGTTTIGLTNVNKKLPIGNGTNSDLSRSGQAEQEADLQYGKFLYRTGEIVWFHRDALHGWHIGVIVRRYSSSNSSSTKEDISSYTSSIRSKDDNSATYWPTGLKYIIIPLSYPGHDLDPVSIDRVELIRPFLTFKLPSFRCLRIAELMQREHQTMSIRDILNSLDWNAVVEESGQVNAEFDAGLLTACSAQEWSSVYQKLKEHVLDNGVRVTQWNGIFVGGEKIWTGEAVRLRGHSGGSSGKVLVVERILECLRPGEEVKILLTGSLFGFTHTRGNGNGSGNGSGNMNESVKNGNKLKPSGSGSADIEMGNGTTLPPTRIRSDVKYCNLLAREWIRACNGRNKTTSTSVSSLNHNAKTSSTSSDSGPLTASTLAVHLVQKNASISVHEVSGRWYEASLLLPIIFNDETVDYTTIEMNIGKPVGTSLSKSVSSGSSSFPGKLAKQQTKITNKGKMNRRSYLWIKRWNEELLGLCSSTYLHERYAPISSKIHAFNKYSMDTINAVTQATTNPSSSVDHDTAARLTSSSNERNYRQCRRKFLQHALPGSFIFYTDSGTCDSTLNTDDSDSCNVSTV